MLYETVEVINQFLDGDEKPYPLPKAKALVAWQSRLWACDGSNIIYHCNNDKPHEWEPLNAIAVQSGQQSTVTALCPSGNQLMVATPKTLWQVTGDSPYNWQYQTVLQSNGAINERCMVSDGQRLFHLDEEGVFLLEPNGKSQLLSDPISKLFETPDASAQLLLDAAGTYLYALIHGRLMVLNTGANHWGEIKAPAQTDDTDRPITGLVMVGDKIAIYGDGGLWLEGEKGAPDVALEGEPEPVTSLLRTWPTLPDPYGNAALNRVYLNIESGYGSRHRWRCFDHQYGEAIHSQTLDENRYSPPSLVIDEYHREILYRETTEQVFMDAPAGSSGYQFEHEIQSTGYGKIHNFDPVYQTNKR